MLSYGDTKKEVENYKAPARVYEAVGVDAILGAFSLGQLKLDIRGLIELIADDKVHGLVRKNAIIIILNEIIWYDENRDIAKVEFYADSDTDKFFVKRSRCLRSSAV